MRLKDKVAVITGAGGTIGRVTADRFANEGAKILATDISVEAGESTVKAIKDRGGEAFFVNADISKVPEIEKIMVSAVDTFGKIDILFNNAGNELVKSIHEYTEEEYDSIMDVHLKGGFFCIRYAIPEMLKQKGGVIINMGSILGLSGWLKTPSYCAAKGALVNLTRQIALEYAPDNIRCNCVCPGIVETDMLKRSMEIQPEFVQPFIDNHPMGRVATAAEVADAVVFLASDEAKFITGVSLPVDGGYLSGKS